MCGIAGFIQRRADPATLQKMTDRMRRRGPDGSGHWASEPSPDGWVTSLGHRRLSIIDLEGGTQPLGNETGRVQITFNGEIFNFQDLRPELESRGHRFKTRSDTEVLLHHFEEFGVEGLSQVNGMFAFALWDQDRATLVLARDRAGIKPLYYARLSGGGIAFASELRALLEHPGVSREISQDALLGYFFSDYFHAPQTLFQNVFKLEPGCSLIWENGKLHEPMPFWQIEGILARGRLISVKDAAVELRRLMERSIRRQLISDVPVGVFLSGGIDSSVVAALARKEAGTGIQTFSITFEDPDFDESSYARKVARHLGTDHREETLSEAKLLDSLDSALDALDEPNADPSVLPTYLLSKLTAQSVKVALGGDGGDELFAGYPTYKAHRYAKCYELLPEPVRRHVVSEIISRLPVKLSYQSFEWKAKRFALRWDADPRRRHLRWMSNTDLPELTELLPAEREPWALRELQRTAIPSEDPLSPLLALDFRTYLPGSVLSKVDRASMANSLECRPPFLDNEVVDWAFSLSSELKLRQGTSKYVLKEMARDLLPEDVIFRPKKGFAIPLGRWLRGPLAPRMRRILNESPVWRIDKMRRETFVEWNDSHQAGRADRSKPLWALLVLDHYLTSTSDVRENSPIARIFR